MPRNKQLLSRYLAKTCKISIPASIVLYILRVWGLISFLPGWILLLAIITAVFSSLSYLTLKTYT